MKPLTLMPHCSQPKDLALLPLELTWQKATLLTTLEDMETLHLVMRTLFLRSRLQPLSQSKSPKLLQTLKLKQSPSLLRVIMECITSGQFRVRNPNPSSLFLAQKSLRKLLNRRLMPRKLSFHQQSRRRSQENRCIEKKLPLLIPFIRPLNHC